MKSLDHTIKSVLSTKKGFSTLLTLIKDRRKKYAKSQASDKTLDWFCVLLLNVDWRLEGFHPFALIMPFTTATLDNYRFHLEEQKHSFSSTNDLCWAATRNNMFSVKEKKRQTKVLLLFCLFFCPLFLWNAEQTKHTWRRFYLWSALESSDFLYCGKSSDDICRIKEGVWLSIRIRHHSRTVHTSRRNLLARGPILGRALEADFIF